MKFDILASQIGMERNYAIALLAIYNKPFVHRSQIGATHETVHRLVDAGLIDVSWPEYGEPGLISTPHADELIEKAADVWFEQTGHTLAERKKRQPREIGDELKALYNELTSQLTQSSFTIVREWVDRSNLRLQLGERPHSIREMEVRQKGTLRLYGYKTGADDVKYFESNGYEVRTSGFNNYIDIELSLETINKTVELLKR